MRKPREQLIRAEELLARIQRDTCTEPHTVRDIRDYFSEHERGEVIQRIREKQ